MNQPDNKKAALKVSAIVITANILLAALKLTAGLIGKSQALVTDGINSASDVISTFIVIIGVLLANKKSDGSHRYGHERLECVASIILAILLFGTGALIGYDGVMSIINGTYKEVAKPTNLALIASIVSIGAKVCLFIFAFVSAKRIKSIVLKADSWNHLSDVVASTGTLIGVIFAMYGFPLADVIASILICLFIIKLSFDVFMEATNKMTDKSCDKETVEKMKQTILGVDGVINIDDIKTRMFGNKIYIDVEFAADKNLTLMEAHHIAEHVHHDLEILYPDVKHCTVHVNPYDYESGENVDDDDKHFIVESDLTKIEKEKADLNSKEGVRALEEKYNNERTEKKEDNN